MIEILYFYILPPLAISSFAYIIYMWTTRKTYFEKNQEISKKAIIDFYEETQKNTNSMMELLSKSAIFQIEMINDNLNQIRETQEKLTNQLERLRQNNELLEIENHKKDAILERKMKLIQKLKGEKNVF